eukprot:Platyproteum_vivax@DN7066_c0_g1_i2.p1
MKGVEMKGVEEKDKDFLKSSDVVLSKSERTAFGWLSMWFLLNVVITLYSKAVFLKYNFPYPLIMTTIHMVFTALGVNVCGWIGIFEVKPLSDSAWRTMMWFSILFTVNIWLSNATLMAVSVNLHQVVRTTIPIFTIIISYFFFHKSYPWTLLPPILVVILGVVATVKGEVNFEWFGFFFTIMGSVAAATKAIVTQQSQVGSAGLSSFDMLRALCPLAAAQMIFLAYMLGEVDALLADKSVSMAHAFHLCNLGMVAFFLNFSSFKASGITQPLTMNIAGNVKQVLTSVLALTFFGGVVSGWFIIGLAGAVGGGFWYSYQLQKIKEQNSKPPPKSTAPQTSPSILPSKSPYNQYETIDKTVEIVIKEEIRQAT